MRFIFNRRGSSTSEKQLPIELEIYFSRSKRKIIPTGIKIYPEQWNNTGYVINHIQKKEINQSLKSFRLKFERAINSMKQDRIDLTLENLNERLGKINSFDSITPKNIKLFDDFLRSENPRRKQTTLHGYHITT